MKSGAVRGLLSNAKAANTLPTTTNLYQPTGEPSRGQEVLPLLTCPCEREFWCAQKRICPCTHPCWLVDKRLQTPYQLHPTHGGLPFDGCRAKNQEFQAQRTADTETHLPCLQWEVGPSSAALVDQLSHESVALTTRLGSMHSSLLVLTIYGSLIYGLDLK